jgi:hypothetical protein
MAVRAEMVVEPDQSPLASQITLSAFTFSAPMGATAGQAGQGAKADKAQMEAGVVKAERARTARAIKGVQGPEARAGRVDQQGPADQDPTVVKVVPAATEIT